MAQLAIRGHVTRCKEVIEILEMLGGKNVNGIKGCGVEFSYHINKKGIIDFSLFNTKTSKEGWIILTLGQFLDKYPYKVGDKVLPICLSHPIPRIIRKMWWDGSEVCYYTDNKGDEFTSNDLQPYKEQDMNIPETMKQITDAAETIAVTSERIIEATNQIEPFKELGTDKILYYVDKATGIKYCAMGELSMYAQDGYEFVDDKGNIINAKTISLQKKQSKYPKTYHECSDILQLEHTFYSYSLTVDEERLITSLLKLKRCRDAYWKIAGEVFGLGKPWEYDMTKDDFSYAISYQYDHIQKNEIRYKNSILTFPTEEMRDTFYENFKDLIESCKELL